MLLRCCQIYIIVVLFWCGTCEEVQSRDADTGSEVSYHIYPPGYPFVMDPLSGRLVVPAEVAGDDSNEANEIVLSVVLAANNVGEILLTYENYINASLNLDKSDRELMNNWTTEFQVNQVNITSHYRLDMTRQREHCFGGKKTNPKWKDCVTQHKREIRKTKSSYFEKETDCLKSANIADKEKKQTIQQVEKEIRKWRKSYKYLSHTCRTNNPDDEDAAGLCLVEYMKKDNYDVVFQRLILLKLEAMDALLQQLNSALTDLEDCLKLSLLQFLNSLRDIMETLNLCYSRTNKE